MKLSKNLRNFTKKLVILFNACLYASLFSCTNDIDVPISKFENLETINSISAKNEFARIMAKAIHDKDIREFIKNEALKEIDNDYDVIYHYVKNRKMNNGLTFRENIAQYCKNKFYLDSITQIDQLLTIFVPDINNNFSPQSWDLDNQIPLVTVRNMNKDGKLLAFNKLGESIDLNCYKKPDFPVLVIKSNERIIDVNKMNKIKSVQMGNVPLSNNDGIFAYFLDESFVNTKTYKNDKLNSLRVDIITTPGPNENILNLLLNENYYKSLFININDADCNRDFLYYGINSKFGSVKGPLKTSIREYITSITFNSSNDYDYVVDKNDPMGDWTDGNLEIRFDFIFINNSNTASNFYKIANVAIRDLFTGQNNRTKKYQFPIPIEIFCWDMYTFGTMYKVGISEVDAGTEIERTESVSSTFGKNFELNATVDKIGAKFGGTYSETKQSSVKIKYTNNTDLLGDAFVNFFDPTYIINTQINQIEIDYFILKKQDGNYLTQEKGNGRFFGVNDHAKLKSYINELRAKASAYGSNCIIDIADPISLLSDRGSYLYKYNTGAISFEIQPLPIR